MKNTPPHDLLTRWIKTYYDIDVSHLTHLPLGADLNAAVYKAQTHNQSTYFIKLKRGYSHDIAPTILQFLQEAKVHPIIPPVKTCGGESLLQRDNFTLIIYPFVEGQDGFTRPLSHKQWLNLGKTMRQIHDLNVPEEIQQQLRRETYSPQWRETVRSIYPYLDTECNGDDISKKLWHFIREHRKAIERLVDRAEVLAEKLQNEPLTFVLCHSDIHGGNVLMNHDQLYIVDWDDPIMAPRERDLMFIGGGVANVWNNPEEESLFYEGYGHVEVNKTALAYYRHERIVEDMAVYTKEIFFTEAKRKDKQEMYKHFTNMFIPNGVVDIAFKTKDDS
ncbi:MAG: aminoglycoside phosphotransferase family protein [Alphaproteobacteria bacterium]|nr:aminoglycoside phosphotransferase family protein [Alphaproteobacteria bacterium]